MEKQYSHDRLQQECGNYLWNTYPQTRLTFFHPANEAIKHKAETMQEFKLRLAQRKAIWVLSGVTDLVWYWQGTMYLFDVKVGNDRLSKEQKDFIAAMEKQGAKFYEVNNLEEFKTIADLILK